jgi:hypothetical protein
MILLEQPQSSIDSFGVIEAPSYAQLLVGGDNMTRYLLLVTEL